MGPAFDMSTNPFPPANRTASDPPMFVPDQDLFTWRKRVAGWADYIKVGAELGQSRHIKTMWVTLAQNLYESLPDEQRMVIDHALEEDKDFSLYNADQMQTVQQIVDKIAKDPPTTVVTRVMTSFVKVQNCKRPRDMKFTTYVSKFMALASEHLIHTGGTSRSQVGEVLAFTLLNNANLEKATHQTAKMQLIQTATERQQSHEDALKTYPMTDIDRASIQSSIDKIENMSEAITSIPVDTEDVNILKEKLAKTLEALLEVKTSQTEVLKNTERPSSSDFNSSGLRTRITVKSSKPQISLEDAAAVVRTLEQNAARDDKKFATPQQIAQQMQQFQTTMLAQMQQQMASLYAGSQHAPAPFGGQAEGGRGGRGRGRGRGGRGGGRGGRGGRRRNQPDYCRDCGKSDHRQGDESCNAPNYETLKRKKENEAGGEQDNNGSDPFRSGGSQNN